MAWRKSIEIKVVGYLRGFFSINSGNALITISRLSYREIKRTMLLQHMNIELNALSVWRAWFLKLPNLIKLASCFRWAFFLTTTISACIVDHLLPYNHRFFFALSHEIIAYNYRFNCFIELHHSTTISVKTKKKKRISESKKKTWSIKNILRYCRQNSWTSYAHIRYRKSEWYSSLRHKNMRHFCFNEQPFTFFARAFPFASSKCNDSSYALYRHQNRLKLCLFS